MDTNSLTQSPFAVLTFIVAPALLTNATSVLVMSTINRMLRTRERMSELFDKSHDATTNHDARYLAQVDRVEHQAVLLLAAMRSLYVALGAFAAATLVTLIGAVLAHWDNPEIQRSIAAVSLLLGLTGVSGLILGCLSLFRATQLSMLNIREEAALIRERYGRQGR